MPATCSEERQEKRQKLRINYIIFAFVYFVRVWLLLVLGPWVGGVEVFVVGVGVEKVSCSQI